MHISERQHALTIRKASGVIKLLRLFPTVSRAEVRVSGPQVTIEVSVPRSHLVHQTIITSITLYQFECTHEVEVEDIVLFFSAQLDEIAEARPP